VRPDPAFGLLKLYDDALPHVYGYLPTRCGDTGLQVTAAPEAIGRLPVKPSAQPTLVRTQHLPPAKPQPGALVRRPAFARYMEPDAAKRGREP